MDVAPSFISGYILICSSPIHVRLIYIQTELNAGQNFRKYNTKIRVSELGSLYFHPHFFWSEDLKKR